MILSSGGKYSGKSFSIVGSRNWDSEEVGVNDALLFRCTKKLLDFTSSIPNENCKILIKIQKIRSGQIVDLMKKSKC